MKMVRPALLLLASVCALAAVSVASAAPARPVLTGRIVVHADGRAVTTLRAHCLVGTRLRLTGGRARTFRLGARRARVVSSRLGSHRPAVASIRLRVLGVCAAPRGRVLRMTVPLRVPASGAWTVHFAFLPPRQPPPPPAEHTSGRLAWPVPPLVNAAVVQVSDSNNDLQLDPARDYIVQMPPQPLRASGGLKITGGHNVVVVGGEIDIPWQGLFPAKDSRRALYLKGQTGIAHVEGVLMTGPDISEGIDLDERLGATVQIENVRIDHIHARDEVQYSDNHPDLIQTWAGPAALEVDHFTGSTDYQGFFLHPQQDDPTAAMQFADLRNVNLAGDDKSGYLLWQADPFRKLIDRVWLQPNPVKPWSEVLWPSPAVWPGVGDGAPSGGDFVPAGSVGIGYRSPG